MTSHASDPQDPDWWRSLPRRKLLVLILVNLFTSPGRRWWIEWSIGILVLGSLVMAAVLYCCFFPDSLFVKSAEP